MTKQLIWPVIAASVILNTPARGDLRLLWQDNFTADPVTPSGPWIRTGTGISWQGASSQNLFWQNYYDNTSSLYRPAGRVFDPSGSFRFTLDYRPDYCWFATPHLGGLVNSAGNGQIIFSAAPDWIEWPQQVKIQAKIQDANGSWYSSASTITVGLYTWLTITADYDTASRKLSINVKTADTGQSCGTVDVTLPAGKTFCVDRFGLYDGTGQGGDTWAYADNAAVYGDDLPLATLKDQLRTLITQAQSRNIETAYAEAAATVTEVFMPLIDTDRQSGQTDLANRNQTALTVALNNQIASLQIQLQNGAAAYLRVPRPNMSQVRIQNGEFYVGNDPVLLVGPNAWLWDIHTDRTRFGQLGYNNVRIAMQPSTCYDSSGNLLPDIPWWALTDCRRSASASNYALTALVIFPYDIWNVVASRGQGVTISSYRTELSNWINLVYQNGSDFMHEIAVEGWRPPAIFEAARHYTQYRAWLQTEYGTIANYNSICGTSFSSFDTVTYPALNEWNPGRKYDRVAFWKTIVADELKWAADQIHGHNPNAIVSGYPSSLMMDATRDFFTDAPDFDPELDQGAYALADADTTFNPPTTGQPLSSIGLCMYRDLWAALGYGKPGFDGEWHPYNTWPWTYPARYTQALYIQNYIHGLSGSQVWAWTRGVSDSALLRDAQICLDTSSTALDLRRLSSSIVPFHAQPADIAILYSQVSTATSGHLTQMGYCYQGLFYEGPKIAFVTERQVEAGALSRFKLLIVPSATRVSNAVVSQVEQFVNNGGTAILVGSCFGYDRRSQPRTWNFSSSRLIKYPTAFSGASQAQTTLAPWLTNLSLRPVYTVTGSGVEWRYARNHEGTQDLIYLLNMNATPATVSITKAGAPVSIGWDPLAGQVVGPTLTLQGLETRLIVFDLTPVTVQGTIDIQGFLADKSEVGVRLQFQPTNGTPSIVRQVFLNSDGTFHVDITRGIYDVTVAIAGWLQTTRHGVMIWDNPTVLDPIIVNAGDANGDNRVGFQDFAILQNNYNQTGASSLQPSSSAVAQPSGGCGAFGILLLTLVATTCGLVQGKYRSSYKSLYVSRRSQLPLLPHVRDIR